MVAAAKRSAGDTVLLPVDVNKQAIAVVPAVAIVPAVAEEQCVDVLAHAAVEVSTVVAAVAAVAMAVAIADADAAALVLELASHGAR